MDTGALEETADRERGADPSPVPAGHSCVRHRERRLGVRAPDHDLPWSSPSVAMQTQRDCGSQVININASSGNTATHGVNWQSCPSP